MEHMIPSPLFPVKKITLYPSDPLNRSLYQALTKTPHDIPSLAASIAAIFFQEFGGNPITIKYDLLYNHRASLLLLVNGAHPHLGSRLNAYLHLSIRLTFSLEQTIEIRLDHDQLHVNVIKPLNRTAKETGPAPADAFSSDDTIETSIQEIVSPVWCHSDACLAESSKSVQPNLIPNLQLAFKSDSPDKIYLHLLRLADFLNPEHTISSQKTTTFEAIRQFLTRKAKNRHLSIALTPERDVCLEISGQFPNLQIGLKSRFANHPLHGKWTSLLGDNG